MSYADLRVPSNDVLNNIVHVYNTKWFYNLKKGNFIHKECMNPCIIKYLY